VRGSAGKDGDVGAAGFAEDEVEDFGAGYRICAAESGPTSNKDTVAAIDERTLASNGSIRTERFAMRALCGAIPEGESTPERALAMPDSVGSSFWPVIEVRSLVASGFPIIWLTRLYLI
jgi:hypothetical protein